MRCRGYSLDYTVELSGAMPRVQLMNLMAEHIFKLQS